jgi:alanyl-tRNA synthetase
MDEKIADARKLEAPKLIKEDIALLIKGGGGGQKYFATAGGQDTSKLQEVIEKVKDLI